MSDDWQVVEEARRYMPPKENQEFGAALARLREREAQQGNLAVALDATIKRAEAAEHDLAMERSLNESYKLANEQHQARVARLEEALREIAVGYQDVLSGPDVDRIMALAHEEEA